MESLFKEKFKEINKNDEKNKLIKNAKKVDKFLKNFKKTKIFFAYFGYEIWSNFWWKKIRTTLIFDAGKLFRLKENKFNLCSVPLLNVFIHTH